VDDEHRTAVQRHDLCARVFGHRAAGVPIGAFGHSQGGWVVYEAVGAYDDFDFAIANSGPGVTPPSRSATAWRQPRGAVQTNRSVGVVRRTPPPRPHMTTTQSQRDRPRRTARTRAAECSELYCGAAMPVARCERRRMTVGGTRRRRDEVRVTDSPWPRSEMCSGLASGRPTPDRHFRSAERGRSSSPNAWWSMRLRGSALSHQLHVRSVRV
jgi:hypothetical protein